MTCPESLIDDIDADLTAFDALCDSVQFDRIDTRLLLHRAQRERLAVVAPGLVADGPLLRVFAYLLSAPRSEDEIPFPGVLVSRLAKNNPTLAKRDSHINVSQYLKRLRAFDITVEASKWNWRAHEARCIYEFSLPLAIEEALAPQSVKELIGTGLLDLSTGRTVKREQLHHDWLANQQLAIASIDTCPDERSRQLLRYMNETLLPGQFRYSPDQIQRAFDAAIAIPKPESRWSALRGLQNCLLIRQAVYTWGTKTPRIYVSGFGLPTLHREIRQILLEGCLDMDLANCQAAAFAAVFNITSLYNLLYDKVHHKGQSLWEYLGEICGIELTTDNKAVLKRAIYRLVFGGSKRKLFKAGGKITRDMLVPFTAEVRTQFFAAPIVQDMFAARRRVLKKISLKRGMHDAYGNWIAIDKSDPCRANWFDGKSVLAYVMQSYETLLMQPIIDLTLSEGMKDNGWYLKAWMYDGAAIQPKHTRHREDICTMLTAAVDAHAAKLGIPTKLEIEFFEEPAAPTEVTELKRQDLSQTRENVPAPQAYAGCQHTEIYSRQIDNIEAVDPTFHYKMHTFERADEPLLGLVQTTTLADAPTLPIPALQATYGLWTPVATPMRKGARWIVRCICDCGETERDVLLDSLRRGKSTSCGCQRRCNNPAPHTTHGQSGTRLYRIWLGMRRRCDTPSDTAYQDYGARGITVCPEWQHFEAFATWAHEYSYTDTLTIDRIDVNGPYAPGNCRWVTPSRQRNNTRRSRYLTIYGEDKTIADWSRDARCEVNPETFKSRLHRGWEPVAALRAA